MRQARRPAEVQQAGAIAFGQDVTLRALRVLPHQLGEARAREVLGNGEGFAAPPPGALEIGGAQSRADGGITLHVDHGQHLRIQAKLELAGAQRRLVLHDAGSQAELRAKRCQPCLELAQGGFHAGARGEIETAQRLKARRQRAREAERPADVRQLQLDRTPARLAGRHPDPVAAECLRARAVEPQTVGTVRLPHLPERGAAGLSQQSHHCLLLLGREPSQAQPEERKFGRHLVAAIRPQQI